MRARIRRSVVLVAALALGVTGCTDASKSDTGGTAAPASGQPSSELVLPRVDPAIAALFPDAVKAAGEIQLAADPSYPPSTFKDDSGKIVGIGPDLAAAVTAKAGLKIKWVEVPFDGMLGGLQAKRFAASWAGWSITAERLQILNFVTFLKGGTSVLVKSGNPTGVKAVEDLCGKNVAVQTGTTQAQQVLDELQKKCEAAGKAKITDVQLPQQTNVNQAVATGRAEALLADNSLTAYQAKIQPGVFEAVPSILIQPVDVGVAIPKSDSRLTDALAAAFNAIIADGTYGKVLARWEITNAAVAKSEINPAAS